MLDLERLTKQNPLLAGDGVLSAEAAARLIGLTPDMFLSELLGMRVSLFSQAQNWQGWSVADLSDCLDTDNTSFVLNEVEARGDFGLRAGMFRIHNTRRTLGAILASGQSPEEVWDDESGFGGFFPCEPVSVSVRELLVPKSAVEAIRSRLAGVAEAQAEKCKEEAVNGSDAGSGGMASSPVIARKEGPDKSGERFSNLFEACKAEHTRPELSKKEKAWGLEHRTRMTTEAQMFVELMDDPLLEQINHDLLRSYRAKLQELPKDIYQARRKSGLGERPSLVSLIEWTKKNDLPRKSAKTADDHLTKIAQIIRWGEKAGKCGDCGAGGFQKARSQNPASSRRDAFSVSDLKQIFESDLFKRGACSNGDGFKYLHNSRPHHYWLPILGLTVGARINELSQLYLDDIKQSEDGSCWFIDFNLIQPDKVDADDPDDYSDAEDKSLKTLNAQRVVPLSQKVLNLGFLGYVEALRQAGHMRLFPELKHDEKKGYGKAAGKWFNEHFMGKKLKVERNGKKVFHSFRHTFVTATVRAKLDLRDIAQLAGHERGKGTAQQRYAKDMVAVELKPVVERMISERPEFHTLDLVKPFDAGVGIQAVKNALRWKQSNAMKKKSIRV